MRFRRRRLRRFRLVATLVAPAYVGWGVGPVMLRSLLDDWEQFGLNEVEFSWIYDNNQLSRVALEKLGGEPIVTHQIFERRLAVPANGSANPA